MTLRMPWRPAPAPVSPIPDPPLDEPSLRRPDFVGVPRSVAVVLADGKAWMIPKPVLELRLDFDPDGQVAGFNSPSVYGDGGTKTLGPAYLEMLNGAIVSDDPLAGLNAIARCAAILLRHNYRLTPGHLRALLPRVPGDDTNQEMWEAIRDIVGGYGPKREGDGGESGSSSPEGT